MYCMYVRMYAYVYIYIHLCNIDIYIYIYTYTQIGKCSRLSIILRPRVPRRVWPRSDTSSTCLPISETPSLSCPSLWAPQVDYILTWYTSCSSCIPIGRRAPSPMSSDRRGPVYHQSRSPTSLYLSGLPAFLKKGLCRTWPRSCASLCH